MTRRGQSKQDLVVVFSTMQLTKTQNKNWRKANGLVKPGDGAQLDNVANV